MMKTSMRNILSVLFALLLAVSLCALPVLAAEAVETDNAAETAAAETAAPAEEEAAAEEEAEESKDFQFEPMNFVKNLKYMGVGMLCIIIVIGLLIVVTMVLNKVTAPKKK